MSRRSPVGSTCPRATAATRSSGPASPVPMCSPLRWRRPRWWSGTVTVLGRDTAGMSGRDRFAIRRDVQIVFQDPFASLDPRMPVGDILAEPLATHGVPKAKRHGRIRDLLRLVGLSPEHAG